MSLLNYSQLAKALQKTTLSLHASQAHGLICGILCAHKSPPQNWEILITGEENNESTHEILQRLYSESAKQLKDFSFEFQLLLPNDDEQLTQRAEAISLWTQGFLTGLKVMNIPLEGREPSDASEAINDLIEIAKMNYEAVVSNEEDENAYAELVEYMRMAVNLIYQDWISEEESEEKIQESLDQLH